MLKKGFGLKDYFQQLDLHDSRNLFKQCCSVSRFCKMNYKNYPIYIHQLWKCSCGQLDSEKHLLICSNFADLREKLDLNDIKDLCWTCGATWGSGWCPTETEGPMELPFYAKYIFFTLF